MNTRLTALELAETICRQAPLGVQAVLRNSRLAQSRGAAKALGKIHGELLKLLISKDIRRGFRAFKGLRPAEFKSGLIQ